MSMSLSFTSAVSPAVIQPATAPRAQTEVAQLAALIKPPAAMLSQNSLNARNLLDSLVSDISAAAAPVAGQGVSRGQQSQPGDYALALLAKDVYNLNGQGTAGFTRLSDSALFSAGIDPTSLHDVASGFQAGIYSDDKQFVLAIAGHSLGGGLAATAALATGAVAVTFNAVGVSDYTLNRLGIDPAAAKQDAQAGGIRRYSEQYDMLTVTQESTPLIPDAIGHNITLANTDTLSGVDDWRPSRHRDRSLTAHGIDKAISSMAEQKPWEAKANA